MDEVVIASAVRTPVGKFLGQISSLSASELGARAIGEAVARAGIKPEQVDEVVMGNVVSAGTGQAPARQAAMGGGIPAGVPAVTINKVCGSGLKAVIMASQAIQVGDAAIVVAGGMESMSNAPFLLKGLRQGYRLGHQQIFDSVISDGLWCVFEKVHMGTEAEWIAARFDISREEQDRFALESHRKAVRATEEGIFKAEMLPLKIPQRKGAPLLVDRDESPRPDTSLEKLEALKPAFQKGGTVTAGNAPGLNDGAAALVVMREQAARRHGVTPLARITGYTVAALEPAMIFHAPVLAVEGLLEKQQRTIHDFDLIEINEAFAAQVLANGKVLAWDWARVNVHGGAIALGHPIGASGARILTTLLYALQQRDLKTGLATLCLGGGGAVAMSVERI